MDKPFPQEETPYKSEMTLCTFGDQVTKKLSNCSHVYTILVFLQDFVL